jgi:phage tail sheath protein FI
VFEPNAPATWRKVEAGAAAFLDDLWRSGALAGSRPADAFFIRCGFGATMTQADLDAGRIVAEVGVALVKPAEFLVLRVTLAAAAGP